MKKQRFAFIDNYKSFIILLVIVHHSAIAFMSERVLGWGIYDVSTSRLFDAYIGWEDAFIMSVMFFISGYFAVASINKRTNSEFFRAKWRRIALPWIIGITILAPINLRIAHNDLPEWTYSLLNPQYWLQNFYTAQYWYLGLLLWFYLLLLIIYRLKPKVFAQKSKPKRTGYVFFVVFGIIVFLTMYCMSLFFGEYDWSHCVFLECQWVRLPQFVLFFICGIWAYVNRWFHVGEYSPKWRYWKYALIVSTIIYLALRIFTWEEGTLISGNTVLLITAFVRTIISVSVTFSGIAFFQKYANKKNQFWRSLGNNAFVIYWIQQPIVTVFSVLACGIPGICYLKFLGVACITLAVCWPLSHCLMRTPLFSPDGKFHSIMKS